MLIINLPLILKAKYSHSVVEFKSLSLHISYSASSCTCILLIFFFKYIYLFGIKLESYSTC